MRRERGGDKGEGRELRRERVGGEKEERRKGEVLGKGGRGKPMYVSGSKRVAEGYIPLCPNCA